MKGYAAIAKPLHILLCGHENLKHSKSGTTVAFDEDAKAAFATLKEALKEPPILGHADYNKPFELHTDAFQVGFGAVLFQEQEGKLRVIAYASRSLKPSETRYPAHKLEFLALKWAIFDKYHDYLYGHKCEVLTDNNLLSYVLTTAKLDATGHCWLAELSTFNFSIKYRSKQLNRDVDALSRLSQETISEDPIKAISNSIAAVQEEGIAEVICLDQQLSPGVMLSDAAGHLCAQEASAQARKGSGPETQGLEDVL